MSRVRSLVRRHPAAVFVALAVALSWTGWLPGVAGRLPGATDWLPGLAPAVAGVAVAVVSEGRAGVRTLARRLGRWRGGVPWAFAVAFPVVGVGVVTLVGGAGDVSSLSTPDPQALAVVVGWALAGELGWRGVCLPALQRSYSPLASSVLLGAAWTAWATPSVAVSTVGAPVAWLSLHLVALSVLFTWLYNRTGGSLLVGVGFHAGLVAVGWLLPTLATRATESSGFVAGAVLAAATAALVAFAPSGFDDPPSPERRGRRRSTEWL
ncbi:MAG: lysostaphin resistance A-like protein [Haloplanus sp.]